MSIGSIKSIRYLYVTACAICAALCFYRLVRANDLSARGKTRLVILMVWDGLRPDLVNPELTPHLAALADEGVRFAHHHAVFPTVTMVNAAVIATGVMPEYNGLMGNVMYFAPFFPGADSPSPAAQIQKQVRKPLFIENSPLLVALDGPQGLDGRLLLADSIGQEVEREGGFLGIAGKRGPTLMFDHRVDTVHNGRDRFGLPHADYIFVASDLVEPPSLSAQLAPKIPHGDPTEIAEDSFVTQAVIKYALPRAKAALAQGKPALIVLWQRNPDASQHRYGLGSAQALSSLAACDRNLSALRQALADLGLADKTDLIVVSDHGFATVKASIKLASLLVKAGLKRSEDSEDIVVADNGGSDEIFVSHKIYRTDQERHVILRKIVEMAAGQNWCGPIFSGPAADEKDRPEGAIEGTFNLARFGLYEPSRSPDLIISYREHPDEDNVSLMGPESPAFVVDARGMESTANHSSPAVRSVKGTVYSDVVGYFFGTGMGMHGAAGIRELHNFAAAVGPDFRRHFVDDLPTGSLDIAPTIAYLLGLHEPFGSTHVALQGRVLAEAMVDGKYDLPRVRHFDLVVQLSGPQSKVTSVLHLSAVGNEEYIDSSDVTVRRN